jgi:hypothetical protein
MKTFLLFILVLVFVFDVFAQSNAGNALLLDGINDFASPLSPNASGLDSCTIEFWFSPITWTNNNNLYSGSRGLPGTNGDSIRIGSHPSAGDDNFIFGVYDNGWQWNNSGLKPGTNNWMHVACVCNSKGLFIFINGELTSANPYSSGMPNFTYELIGTSSWSEYFKGYIDELRIWNRNFESAAITSRMLDTLSSEYYSTADSGLIAYYKMEALEDLGLNFDGADDIRDLSVFGNHLDTYGGPALATSGAFVITEVSDEELININNFCLNQNYPNPFNPSTTIKYSIPYSDIVNIKVFDILGREVAVLLNEYKPAGTYNIEFNANKFTSGVYFYQLNAGSYLETKKMMLMK